MKMKITRRKGMAIFAILSASAVVVILIGDSVVYKNRIWKNVNRNSDTHPLLLDVTEVYLAKETTGNESEHRGINTTFHKILWNNIPPWISLGTVNQCLTTCSYKNCQFVKNKTLISHSSAVIFCSTRKGNGAKPPLQTFERPKNQVWILFEMETPVYLEKRYRHFRPTWRNSFNWTMNFRLDSDITIPYGYLKTKRFVPYQNYSEIYRNKTKFAAWIVSHCKTVSLRRKFVEKLVELGIDVDVYGKCGMSLEMDPLEMISKKYKFFLSFENSLCSDYITEKFFKYFALNTILVVRGGADYKSLVPDNTYINTADFNTIAELAMYLKAVGSSKALYTSYLKAKYKYSPVWKTTNMCPSFCGLCRKLNNIGNHGRVYGTVPNYLETCYKPYDIDNKSRNIQHYSKSVT